MPFNTTDLRNALAALQKFKITASSPHHARYIFPFFCGTYFAYRKVDVMRVVAIARAASGNTRPSYLDVGCGYGDFLDKVREFIPDAMGIEKDAGIFYGLGIPKPEYIRIADAFWIDGRYDLIFVGWMEPGVDFRDRIAKSTDVIVTTLDQGLSLAAEFDGHGFERVAWWRTPSWEDVNTEITNLYYSGMSKEKRADLARLRGAHNLWYVYSRPERSAKIRAAIESHLVQEANLKQDHYDFEDVLDECGYGYMQQLGQEEKLVAENHTGFRSKLWQINFDR